MASQVLWNLAVVDSTALGDPTMVPMDAALWDYHFQTGLAAMPFSATANGLFNKLERRPFTDLSPFHQKLYAAPENVRRFERAHRLAQEKDLSITQVVLGYLLSQPFPTYPIIGPRNVAQLLDSLSAAPVRLTDDELGFLEGRNRRNANGD